jgi:hypothetical protein
MCWGQFSAFAVDGVTDGTIWRASGHGHRGRITLPGTDNGSFRTDIRSEVYYTYEVLEWGQGRSLTASGDDPSAVRWPDDPLGAGERVKSRHEEYSATFEAAGKRYETSLPEQEWRSLERGSSCTLSLGLLGGVKRVHPGG